MTRQTNMPRDFGGAPIPVLHPGRTAAHTVGAASTEVDLPTLFTDSGAKVWRLQASAACHIRTEAGAATTADMPLAADMPEMFEFDDQADFRVIQASAGGTLWITEML